MIEIVVYGAGGLALEVRNIIKRINRYNKLYDDELYKFLGFVTTSGDKSEEGVVGNEDLIRQNDSINVAIGIGNPKVRFDVGTRLCEEIGEKRFPPLIDPSAIFDFDSCEVRCGAIIAQNVVGTVNILFDNFSYVNLSCTLGHGASIGRGSMLNPGANLSGDVKLGDKVLVGTGAKILEKRIICSGSTVGAGAVVVKDVLEPITVVGIPAKKLNDAS